MAEKTLQVYQCCCYCSLHRTSMGSSVCAVKYFAEMKAKNKVQLKLRTQSILTSYRFYRQDAEKGMESYVKNVL